MQYIATAKDTQTEGEVDATGVQVWPATGDSTAASDLLFETCCMNTAAQF